MDKSDASRVDGKLHCRLHKIALSSVDGYWEGPQEVYPLVNPYFPEGYIENLEKYPNDFPLFKSLRQTEAMSTPIKIRYCLECELERERVLQSH